MLGDRVGRRDLVLSTTAGAVFLFLCSMSWRQSYTYDESITIGLFVRRDSFIDAVTSQFVFNNHPSLTALNWVVYRLGGETEAWQRLVPMTAGTACVIVVVLWSVRRWGLLAGIAAAAVTAVNPLLVSLSTQARGYSLAALAVAVSTTLVGGRNFHRCSWVARAGYAICIALGLLAHLYVGIAVVGHGIWILRHRPGSVRVWARATAAGGLLTTPIYLSMLSGLLNATTARQGDFVADFPLTVGDVMFGQRLASIVAAALVLAALYFYRETREFAATVACLVAIIWLLVQPSDLYPRFLVWAVPLFGLSSAAVVARDRRWIVAVLLLAYTSTSATIDTARVEPEIRTVASAAGSYESQGFAVCTAIDREAFLGYRIIPAVSDDVRCDLVLVDGSDMDDPRLPEGSFASIPNAPGTCVAGRPATLRALGLVPETCAS